MVSYKNKKVTVVGLARSGVAAVRLLLREGARVSVTEKAKTPALEETARQLKQEGVDVELGVHTPGFVTGRDLVVISPGVRPDAEPVKWAQKQGIDVISEIELAASLCPATIIAITGTNGKTTTTTLVGEVLRAAGRTAYILGNIGTPFSQLIPEMKSGDFVSLEVSSFQLETIRRFHPRVAAILNITPDHLDRYKDVSEYLQAKKRIWMNQDKNDFLVLNAGDPMLRVLDQEALSKVIFFNTEGDDPALDQNQQAVVAIAGCLGVSPDVCRRVFATFKGVEHRMEFVRELDGVVFINDSKATNIDSTVWALRNIRRPAILLAGGRDKGSDFASILPLVKEKVKRAVLVGEASDRIRDAWQGALPLEQFRTFDEAVRAAHRSAVRGDCVLFSPMCKSFDLFTDYEHRGRTFKEIVGKL